MELAASSLCVHAKNSGQSLYRHIIRGCKLTCLYVTAHACESICCSDDNTYSQYFDCWKAVVCSVLDCALKYSEA